LSWGKHKRKRKRKRQVRRWLPGPVARHPRIKSGTIALRLTDGPWLAFAAAGVMAKAGGDGPSTSSG